jgi:hypothetical protein
VTAHYGCWNTKRRDGYWVQDGAFVEAGAAGDMRRVVSVSWHEDTGSREWRYDRRPTDPRCVGCLKP